MKFEGSHDLLPSHFGSFAVWLVVICAPVFCDTKAGAPEAVGGCGYVSGWVRCICFLLASRFYSGRLVPNNLFGGILDFIIWFDPFLFPGLNPGFIPRCYHWSNSLVSFLVLFLSCIPWLYSWSYSLEYQSLVFFHGFTPWCPRSYSCKTQHQSKTHAETLSRSPILHIYIYIYIYCDWWTNLTSVLQ